MHSVAKGLLLMCITVHVLWQTRDIHGAWHTFAIPHIPVCHKLHVLVCVFYEQKYTCVSVCVLFQEILRASYVVPEALGKACPSC